MRDPTGVLVVPSFQDRYILLRALLSHHKTVFDDFIEQFVDSGVSMALAWVDSDPGSNAAAQATNGSRSVVMVSPINCEVWREKFMIEHFRLSGHDWSSL